MARLRPPGRGNDPLHVLPMVLALIAAAIVGAGLGFAIDFFSGAGHTQGSTEKG
jgi:hypothetical protein